MKLELEKVTKVFRRGEKEASGIREISLNIEEGDFLGIYGESGCGKSTLFHMIAGILTPDSGTITLDGKEICKQGKDWLASYRNQIVGYIMQGNSLVSHLTVLENLYLPFIFAGGGRTGNHCFGAQLAKDWKARGKEVLHAVKMDGYERQYPGQLSGGEQNRIQIARALMMQPKIILADEPTNGLDYDKALSIMELLKDIAKSGTAVLVSTHQQEYMKTIGIGYDVKAGRMSSVE